MRRRLIWTALALGLGLGLAATGASSEQLVVVEAAGSDLSPVRWSTPPTRSGSPVVPA